MDTDLIVAVILTFSAVIVGLIFAISGMKEEVQRKKQQINKMERAHRKSNLEQRRTSLARRIKIFRTTCIYSNQGFCKRESETFWDSVVDSMEVDTTEYEYNINGSVVLEKRNRRTNGATQHISTKERRYDKANHLIELIEKDELDQVFRRETFTYRNGVLMQEEHYNSYGDLRDKISYFYDDGFQLIREELRLPLASKKFGTPDKIKVVHEHIYVKNGRRSKTIVNKSDTISYTYNDQGLLVEETTRDPERLILATILYSYDENGKLASSISESYSHILGGSSIEVNILTHLPEHSVSGYPKTM